MGITQAQFNFGGIRTQTLSTFHACGRRKKTAVQAWGAVKSWAHKVPTAMASHDGNQQKGGGGEQLKGGGIRTLDL